MEKTKVSPWIDRESEYDLFQLSKDDIRRALELRSEFDYDYGTRLRGDSTLKREWVVGFHFETADDDDSCWVRFFDWLAAHGETQFYSMPSMNVRCENTGMDDIIDHFDPPLIAKGNATYESYIQIRSGLVQILRGGFFIFPLDETGVALNVNGKYSMFSGPRNLVEYVLGDTVENSWKILLSPAKIEPELYWRLNSAISAYGIQV